MIKKSPLCPYCYDGVIVKDKAEVCFCEECFKEKFNTILDLLIIIKDILKK